MSPINVISIISILLMGFTISKQYNFDRIDSKVETDTIFVLYQNIDQNQIKKSSRIHPDKNCYPKDWGRSFNIINKNIHIWLTYHNDLPEWSDMVFEYKEIDQSFIASQDFKDQEWFRSTPEEEIYDTFLGKNKVIYLVEKDRIQEGKAIMIRVYPDIPTVE